MHQYRKIKSPNLAQLLMQLRFTPEAKRRVQLEAAEKLFCLIDPQKQYPYDFVCFHVTGFQPKGSPEPEVIAGCGRGFRIGVSQNASSLFTG